MSVSAGSVGLLCGAAMKLNARAVRSAGGLNSFNSSTAFCALVTFGVSFNVRLANAYRLRDAHVDMEISGCRQSFVDSRVQNESCEMGLHAGMRDGRRANQSGWTT